MTKKKFLIPSNRKKIGKFILEPQIPRLFVCIPLTQKTIESLLNKFLIQQYAYRDTRMFQRVNFRPENFFSRKNFYLRRGKVKAFAYLAKLPAYFKKTINNTTNFSLYIELATK